MRSGWNRLVWSAAAGALAAGLWALGAGAAEVKNVTAEYAWPWGAEIRYEVTGTLDTNASLVVTATDRANNATYTAEASALSGDMGSKAGSHRLIWDMDKQGVKIQSTNVVFTVEYLPMYFVVDLSGGANASSYPVTYMDTPPNGGFNTDAYKTTKLVLRRIEPGTFSMGTNKCQVTLTKAYYIGVFEVTQRQYELVTGDNPSYTYGGAKGDKKPVQQVSWNTIRGNTNWPTSSAVSANSFMGRLRARTGLEFDLPTEAQWEYACLAGTTSKYNNGGNTENDLKKLGLYGHSSQGSGGYNSPAIVGSYLPNAWGLYDMHGNVREWCLDWSGNLSSGVKDPKGPSSGSRRVQRGGCWWSSAGGCTSTVRYSGDPSSIDYYRIYSVNGITHNDYYSSDGFRLVGTLSN